jgi:hypothetical protein
MKRLVLLSVLLVAMILATGCGEGIAITRRERQERHKRILENDWKQINDDWDSFWLNDREGRLTWSRVE